MKRWWRRYWPVVTATAATVAVVAFLVGIHLSTREPPNYSRIEDGLYLGGRVPEPPRGTRAVLNLCENEDVYRAEVHRGARSTIPSRPRASSGCADRRSSSTRSAGPAGRCTSTATPASAAAGWSPWRT
jgi:hypothetical protein